jgi:hypothetical protein
VGEEIKRRGIKKNRLIEKTIYDIKKKEVVI